MRGNKTILLYTENVYIGHTILPRALRAHDGVLEILSNGRIL